MKERLIHELDEAETKAWESLARYKFQMFGYWAAIWVHLNRIGEFKRPNPWKALVSAARANADGGGNLPALIRSHGRPLCPGWLALVNASGKLDLLEEATGIVMLDVGIAEAERVAELVELERTVGVV